ncbi:hypothetical protein Tco_1578893, partial [Tanacetum coccineum]
IVDFLQASHIRIEIVDRESNILAKINGKQRTISELSIKRHLKLNEEEGIGTLPDNELFKNLSLMGSENQLESHHTPSTQHVSPPHPTHTSSPHEIQSTPPEA